MHPLYSVRAPIVVTVVLCYLPYIQAICPDDCHRGPPQCFPESDEPTQCSTSLRLSWGVYYTAAMLLNLYFVAKAWVEMMHARATNGPFRYNIYHVAYFWPFAYAGSALPYTLTGIVAMSHVHDNWSDGGFAIMTMQVGLGLSLCFLGAMLLHLAFFWQALLRGTSKLGPLKAWFILFIIVLTVIETVYRIERVLSAPGYSRMILYIYLLYLLFLISGVCLWALYNVRRLNHVVERGNSFRYHSSRKTRASHVSGRTSSGKAPLSLQEKVAADIDRNRSKRTQGMRQKRSFITRVTRYVYGMQIAMGLVVVATMIYAGIRLALGYHWAMHLTWVALMDISKFYTCFAYLGALHQPSLHKSVTSHTIPSTPTITTTGGSTGGTDIPLKVLGKGAALADSDANTSLNVPTDEDKSRRVSDRPAFLHALAASTFASPRLTVSELLDMANNDNDDVEEGASDSDVDADADVVRRSMGTT